MHYIIGEQLGDVLTLVGEVGDEVLLAGEPVHQLGRQMPLFVTAASVVATHFTFFGHRAYRFL